MTSFECGTRDHNHEETEGEQEAAEVEEKQASQEEAEVEKETSNEEKAEEEGEKADEGEEAKSHDHAEEHQNGDEDYGATDNDEDMGFFGRRKRQAPVQSLRPLEVGVVRTPSGTVAMGAVLAGIAAGGEPQAVPVSQSFLIFYLFFLKVINLFVCDDS